jgi:type IV secretory system conjugative DNA transfer VirD4/TraG family protein
MLERVSNSRTFMSFVLAAITGIVLFYRCPFPQGNLYLQYVAVKDPLVYSALARSYTLFLFTTPFFIYSTALSGVYVLSFRRKRKQKTSALPPFPDPGSRNELFLVLGEIHHPTKIVPGTNPQWLMIPEKGLFTGIGIFGAVGTGKTSCCMRPFAEQLIAFKANEPDKRIGGLVLEVKGDFCHQIREIAQKNGREEDYVEIALDSEYRYNPLHNNLDSSALAYSVASLLNNLYGRGKEPFWQQAYTNMLQHIILLHKVLYDYVSFFDVYECAISPPKLEKRIEEGRYRFEAHEYISVTPEVFGNEKFAAIFSEFHFVYDDERGSYKAPITAKLDELLRKHEPSLQYQRITTNAPPEVDDIKRQQLEAVQRWYFDDWMGLERKLRSSIVEGVSIFLSLFDINPAVKRVFCPPRQTYDPAVNKPDEQGHYPYGKPLPSLSWLIEQGKICALNFPVSLNAGLARILGTMLKLDFERAVLLRIPEIERNNKKKHFRQVFLMCDEYQTFATVGESDPIGDEKFFSLSRQAKCISIVATQSISSLKSTLSGESYRTLLQTFRTKIFLALSDDFSTRFASELCGREDKPFVTYNISESGQDSKLSLLTGKTVSDRGSISASKSYSMRLDYRFSQKFLAELANAQAVVLPYDGLNPTPATLCYLKPYYLDPNVSYFDQIARGLL